MVEKESLVEEALRRFQTAEMELRSAAWVYTSVSCDEAWRKVREFTKLVDGEWTCFADYRYSTGTIEYKIVYDRDMAVYGCDSVFVRHYQNVECFRAYRRLKSGKWAKTYVRKKASDVKYMALKKESSDVSRKPKTINRKPEK